MTGAKKASQVKKAGDEKITAGTLIAQKKEDKPMTAIGRNAAVKDDVLLSEESAEKTKIKPTGRDAESYQLKSEKK
ncbi:MAG: hypothetical protein HOH77_16755, partial [Candidatus Latescibacteria bacterium]|nr:hypothetical protein [Candidatus Latescibacterota bacterium]